MSKRKKKIEDRKNKHYGESNDSKCCNLGIVILSTLLITISLVAITLYVQFRVVELGDIGGIFLILLLVALTIVIAYIIGIERILEIVEKDRVGIIGAFIVIFTLAYIRSYLESSVFEYMATSPYMRVDHVTLYFAMFITGVLIITAVSGINGRKIFNMVLLGWWIILLPPIIDFLMGHSGIYAGGYPYQKTPDIYLALRRAFDISEINKLGWGEVIQLWSVILLPGVYVYLKKKSALRAFFTSFFLFLLIFYVDISMALLIQMNQSGDEFIIAGFFRFPIWLKYYQGMSIDYAKFLVVQQEFIFTGLYYVIMFIISSLVFFYIYSKERLIAFLQSIKWIRHIIAVFLVFIGVVVGGVLYPEYILHQTYIGFAIVSVISGAQFIYMKEDLLISEKWRFPYTRKQYLHVAYAFAIMALATAYPLGNGPVLFVVLFLLTGYLYTSRPFESAKTGLAPFIFGTFGVFPFLIGFYTPSYWLIKRWIEHFTLHNFDPVLMHSAPIYLSVPHPINQNFIILSITSYILFIGIYLIEKGRNKK